MKYNVDNRQWRSLMAWIGNAPLPVYEISFKYGYSDSTIIVPTNNILKQPLVR